MIQYSNVASTSTTNTYTINQDGSGHTVFGLQDGADNGATINQDGAAQFVDFMQYGSSNSIDVTQSGLLSGPASVNNSAYIMQDGMDKIGRASCRDRG